MKRIHRVWLTALFLAVTVYGCNQQRGPERVPTVPVEGTVLVDGQPAGKMTIRLHARDAPTDEVGVYASHPTALSNDDGSFAFSTYEQGDGVAAGTYTITFHWLTYNALRNTYGRPDKLKGKYADPEKSEFEVTVTGDEDDGIELEPFELTK